MLELGRIPVWVIPFIVGFGAGFTLGVIAFLMEHARIDHIAQEVDKRLRALEYRSPEKKP